MINFDWGLIEHINKYFFNMIYFILKDQVRFKHLIT